MPEPTDHRAEAEEKLAEAFDVKVDIESPIAVAELLWDIRTALIGIGHALLALAEKPQETRGGIVQGGSIRTHRDPYTRADLIGGHE